MINIKLFALILTVILFYCHFIFSQSTLDSQRADNMHQVLSDKELQSIIDGGLKFIENAQVKETKGFEQFAGEWPSYIYLHKNSPFFNEYRFYDSNSFSVIPIHNILAEIFLDFPEYAQIPAILHKSMTHILHFKTDSSRTFGFWPYLSKIQASENTIQNQEGFLMRKPNHFPLSTRFAQQFINVVDDSDDQALAIQSVFYYNLVAEFSNMEKIDLNFKGSIVDIFEKYRDCNRDNAFIFDRVKTETINSGAYLTWFGKEYSFENLNHWNYYCNSLFWFFPFSKLYPRSNNPQVPFLTNDIDVIVNLNIFTTFAKLEILDSLKGLNDIIKMVNHVVFANEFDYASQYYINRYQLHYSLSKAIVASHGKYFNSEAKHLISFLKSKQNPDGSWSGKKSWNDGDTIQSTVNALCALINFGAFEDNKTMDNINKAMLFLHKRIISEGEMKYWKGGIHFAGGYYLRNLLTWHSDSYTTVLIVHALLKYKDLFNEK